MKRRVAGLCLLFAVSGVVGCSAETPEGTNAEGEKGNPQPEQANLELAEAPTLCSELDLAAMGKAVGGTVTQSQQEPDNYTVVYDPCQLDLELDGVRNNLIIGVSASEWKPADLEADSKSYGHTQGGVFDVEAVKGVGDAAYVTEQEILFLAHDRAAFVFGGQDETSGAPLLTRERYVDLAEAVLPTLEGFPVQRDGGIVPECEDATPGIAKVVGGQPRARRDSYTDGGEGWTCRWVGTAKYVTAGVSQPKDPAAELRTTVSEQPGKQKIDLGDEAFLTDWAVAFRNGSYVVSVTPDGFPRKVYVQLAKAVDATLSE